MTTRGQLPLRAWVLPVSTALVTWLAIEPLYAWEVDAVWDFTGWQALEAVGTVAAVLVALLVAIIGWRQNTRKDTQQRNAVRYLLAREIRKDLAELGNLQDWEVCVSIQACKSISECRRDALEKSRKQLRDRWGKQMPDVVACATKLVQVHRHTKDITHQLGLLTVALEPGELVELDEFYDGMQIIHERHSNLLNHKGYQSKEHEICGKECQLVLYQELSKALRTGSNLQASLEGTGIPTS